MTAKVLERILPPAEWKQLSHLLLDDHYSVSGVLEKVVNTPDMRTARRLFLQTAAHGNAMHTSTELGDIANALTGIRFRMRQAPIFQVDDDLTLLLTQTDLGKDIPISMMQLPFPIVYIEMGSRRDIPLFLTNRASGEHVFEGAYLEMGRGFDGDMRFHVLLTGSPVGKTDLLDDTTYSISLLLDSPGHSLHEAIQRIFEHRPGKPTAAELFGFNTADQRDIDNIENCMRLVASALLYIGLPEARKSMVRDRSMALATAASLKSPAKIAKANRRAERTRDFILVSAAAEHQHQPVRGEAASISAHWRRGHWRMQPHGPQLSLRKHVFIKPMFIGAAASNETPVKSYVVR